MLRSQSADEVPGKVIEYDSVYQKGAHHPRRTGHINSDVLDALKEGAHPLLELCRREKSTFQEACLCRRIENTLYIYIYIYIYMYRTHSIYIEHILNTSYLCRREYVFLVLYIEHILYIENTFPK